MVPNLGDLKILNSPLVEQGKLLKIFRVGHVGVAVFISKYHKYSKRPCRQAQIRWAWLGPAHFPKWALGVSLDPVAGLIFNSILKIKEWRGVLKKILQKKCGDDDNTWNVERMRTLFMRFSLKRGREEGNVYYVTDSNPRGVSQRTQLDLEFAQLILFGIEINSKCCLCSQVTPLGTLCCVYFLHHSALLFLL